jgi:hypothetical protein
MKYSSMDWGTMEAVVNRLGGMDGVQRFLSGELIVSVATKVWKTWKKIKLGTGLKDADDFRKALKEADCNISDCGNDILGKPAFMVAPKETEIELVVVSVAELGFKDGATRADIYKRAQELGLDLCPNEVGPQLRLQYKDQSKGEWLLIGMEPIATSVGDLYVFSVKRNDDGRQWLSANGGNPGNVWRAVGRWVFLRRK